jgi:hypothetical protein
MQWQKGAVLLRFQLELVQSSKSFAFVGNFAGSQLDVKSLKFHF